MNIRIMLNGLLRKSNGSRLGYRGKNQGISSAAFLPHFTHTRLLNSARALRFCSAFVAIAS